MKSPGVQEYYGLELWHLVNVVYEKKSADLQTASSQAAFWNMTVENCLCPFYLFTFWRYKTKSVFIFTCIIWCCKRRNGYWNYRFFYYFGGHMIAKTIHTFSVSTMELRIIVLFIFIDSWVVFVYWFYDDVQVVLYLKSAFAAQNHSNYHKWVYYLFFLLYFVVIGGGGTLMSAVAGKMKNLKRKNVSKVEFCIVM